MTQAPNFTYVLDFTLRTITAIELASRYGNRAESPIFKVDVTTADDNAMHRVGLARRRTNQLDGDQFVVELDTDGTGRPLAAFELPFALVMLLARQAERVLSGGSDASQL